MQNEGYREGSQTPTTLQLRVVIIPTPTSEGQQVYRVRVENMLTGETHVLETLDAFEEHIASYVEPLFP